MADRARPPPTGRPSAAPDRGRAAARRRGRGLRGRLVAREGDGRRLCRDRAVCRSRPPALGRRPCGSTRSGVGTQLVDAREDLARDGGATELFLLTESAEAWFARLGYLRSTARRCPGRRRLDRVRDRLLDERGRDATNPGVGVKRRDPDARKASPWRVPGYCAATTRNRGPSARLSVVPSARSMPCPVRPSPA